MKTILSILILTITIKSTIIITSPTVTQFQNNQIQYIYANFGQVPYGKSQTFQLLVLNSSLCNSSQLTQLTKPTYVVIKTNQIQYCSFPKRAQIAQKNGAKGIIIASQSYDYATGNVMQADDGNGRKIHITTLVISTNTFDKLSKLNKIQITANYPVPKSKTSTLSVFISSSKRSSYIFLRNIMKDYKYLKDYMTIEPIYQTIECPTCPIQNCIDKYCTYDYDNFQRNVGQIILKQQLFEYTLFNKKGTLKWLDYMNNFDQWCDGDWYNLQNCRKNILQKINATQETIIYPLQTLNLWKSREVKLRFDNFPQVAINNMIYRGNFDEDQIIDAVCASLQAPPKYCLDKKVDDTFDEKSTSHTTIVVIVVIVTIVFMGIIGVFFYNSFIKRELTRDMTSKVGQLVAHYANKVSKSKHKRQLHQKMQEQL